MLSAITALSISLRQISRKPEITRLYLSFFHFTILSRNRSLFYIDRTSGKPRRDIVTNDFRSCQQ